MMPISWFDKSGIERLNTHYEQKIHFEKFRVYKNLYLNDNGDQEKSEIKRLTDELVVNKDFKNGICIILTNKTKYQELVTALDIAMNKKGLGIIPYYNKIYIFNDNRTIKVNDGIRMPHRVAFLLFDRVDDNSWSHGFYKRFEIYLTGFPTGILQFWPCLVPFVGMIFFWMKRNKNYWSIN
jgi:hypothetical protein